MKIVRIAFKVLVWIVLVAAALVLTLPLWFGPVVTTVANAFVPGVVKTDFRMGHLSLNPYTARFELGDLNLANPKGYSVKDAVRVGDVIFDAETFSLMTDVIHVEEISVRGLFVSVVSGGVNNVLNFKQIQYDVAGGKAKYEAAQSEQEAQSAAVQDNPAPDDGKPVAEKPAKKVIIDRLAISGLTIHLGVLPIKVPSIVLTDIGRKTGGATFEEAWRQILDGIMKSAGIAGEQLQALGALTGDAAKTANEAVSKAAARATDAVGGGAKAVSGTVKAVGDGATAVGDGVKAVGDGAKAVGESAKKAMDSLKGLW